MKSRKQWKVAAGLVTLFSTSLLALEGKGAKPLPAGGMDPTSKSGRAIKVLSEMTLPSALAKAADVRWASERSVYLALRSGGVVEISLDRPTEAPRQVVPGRDQLGGFWYATLVGASGRNLVAAAPAMTITSVDLETRSRWDEAFDAVHALDVQDGRWLVLGMRRDEQRKVGADGAIAWAGPLGEKLKGLRPVAYDAAGPGIRNMDLCGAMRLGGVRFLADGGFVIVPGTQPGVQLYDRAGKLVRSWDTGALGIDTDCGALTYEASRELFLSIEKREEWIDRRRTVDSVLPLPGGIGLVVRSREGGRLRWVLKVLHANGGTAEADLPIEAPSGFFHLRGDFRAGKMIFILAEERAKDDKYPAPRVVIASPPLHD